MTWSRPRKTSPGLGGHTRSGGGQGAQGGVAGGFRDSGGEGRRSGKVDTGITGATDIEVLGGLKEGDEIATGSYKVIRTLRNEARIKVDNKAPVRTES